MAKLSDLYMQPRQLDKDEYNEIRKHPGTSTEILKNFKDIYKRAISVVHQEHERIDGSGYPRGLKRDYIDEYAKIIGLADIYEAVTHLRPYRDKFSPCDVIRQIIDLKRSFEKRIVKVLMERVCTPFPLCSNIRLSSGEEGRVIRRNLASPFRPIIEITSNANGEKLEEAKIIDLTKYPTVYIKRSLEK